MKAIAVIAAMALTASVLVAGCGPSAAELRGYDIERDQSAVKENDATTGAVKADQAKVDAQTQQIQTATAALATMPDSHAKWGAAARVLGFEARDEQYLVNGAVQSSTHYIKGEWRDPPKPARKKTDNVYHPLTDADDVLHTTFSMGPAGACNLKCDPKEPNPLTITRSTGDDMYSRDHIEFQNYDEFAKFVAQAESMERAWRALK